MLNRSDLLTTKCLYQRRLFTLELCNTPSSFRLVRVAVAFSWWPFQLTKVLFLATRFLFHVAKVKLLFLSTKNCPNSAEFVR